MRPSSTILCIIIALVLLGYAFVRLVVIPDAEAAKVDKSWKSADFVPQELYSLDKEKQTLVVIHYEKLHEWILSNKDKHIVTISGLGLGAQGSDTFFMIVFEPSK